MMGGVSGVGGMPDFSRIQAMRQQAFTKADSDGSGGLKVDEFKSLVQSSPLAKTGSAPDVEQAFSQLDGDGDGQLTQTELDDGMKKMMQSMSTQQFAGFSNSGSPSTSTASDSTRAQLQALLDALGQGPQGAESARYAAVDLLA